MSFVDDIDRFEAWLRQHCRVVEDDLKRKHKQMSRDAFSFLRAIFFRWSGQIEALCPDLKTAPVVLAVGDTHVENFGTWRDGATGLGASMISTMPRIFCDEIPSRRLIAQFDLRPAGDV